MLSPPIISSDARRFRAPIRIGEKLVSLSSDSAIGLARFEAAAAEYLTQRTGGVWRFIDAMVEYRIEWPAWHVYLAHVQRLGDKARGARLRLADSDPPLNHRGNISTAAREAQLALYAGFPSCIPESAFVASRNSAIGPCEGEVLTQNPGYRGKDEDGEFALDDKVILRVAERPEKWPYSDTDTFCADVALIQPVK